MEQEKREAILGAAVKCFSRLGFKKTSIDEVARGAGVAKGTVYLACDSKEDLFYQACHREVRAWIARVARMIDPRVPADELLAQVGRAALNCLEEHPLVRQLLAGDYGAMLPGWGVRFDELRAVGRANVVEILELGIKQGRFRADLDVEETATLLQDLQLSTLILHRRDGGTEPERLLRRLAAGLDLVLHGVLARP
jgi:AcrR family transcriptional regulator